MNRKDSLKLMKVRELRSDLRYKEYLKGKQELNRIENLLRAMHGRKNQVLAEAEATRRSVAQAMLSRPVTGREMQLVAQDRSKRLEQVHEIDADIRSATRFQNELKEKVENLRKAYLKATKEVDQWKALDTKLLEEERKGEEIKTELNEEPRAAIIHSA